MSSVTLADLSDSILAAGLSPGSFTLRQSGSTVTAAYADTVSQSQKNAADALIAAFTPPTALQQQRADARAILVSSPEALAKAIRAVALAAGDGDNVRRQWITDFKAAVAAATSLANLQTRVAALSNLAQVTPGMVKTAVANRVDTSDAD